MTTNSTSTTNSNQNSSSPPTLSPIINSSTIKTQRLSSQPISSASNNVVPSSATRQPTSTSSSEPPVADVETTNWNAVAMLASKYGINLRRSGETSRPNPSDLAAENQDDEQEEIDLGIGTPFKITAKKVEGGKIIYRFKSRGPPASSTASTSKSSSNRSRKVGLPDQSSSGSNSSNSKPQKSLKGSRSIPALRASALLRGTALSGTTSSNSTSQDSTSPGLSSSKLQQQQMDSESLESSLNLGLSPSAPGGGALGALAALGLGTRIGMSTTPKPRNVSSPAGYPSYSNDSAGRKANQSGSGYGMQLQDGDVLGAILGLSDLGGPPETLPNSPKTSDPPSNKSTLIPEEIAEQDASAAAVDEAATVGSPSEVRSASSSPSRERRGLRRAAKGLPTGSPSAAFSALSGSSSSETSTRQASTVGLGLSHSVDDPPTFQSSAQSTSQRASHPSPEKARDYALERLASPTSLNGGNDGILLPRSTSAGEVPTLATSGLLSPSSVEEVSLTASQRFNAASAGMSSGPTSTPLSSDHPSWNRSPIPQMEHLGQPLFDDLEAHAISFGQQSPSPEPRIAGVVAEKEEKLRRLREAQSWESGRTTKGEESGADKRLKWSEYPQTLVPHLQANFRTILLEDQLRESDEDKSGSGGSRNLASATSSSHLDMTLYMDEAFIFDVLQHYTQQGAVIAARSRGVDVTRSITFAENTPKTPDLSNQGSSSNNKTPQSRRASIAAAFSPVRGSSNSSNSAAASDLSSSISSASGAGDNSSSVDGSFSASQAQDTSASAAPGDDPRFALWAVKANDAAGTLVLAGRDGVVAQLGSPLPGHGGASNAQSSGSSSSCEQGGSQGSTAKRWSMRANSENPLSGPEGARGSSNQDSAGDAIRDSILFPSGKSSLIAASPIRLVAELTSEIDHRLLTDFFYTYRPFLSPSSLLRLLTLRFHWALSTPQGPHDEARRRIVRVRTYVVIKYWLLHFFEVDFLPDRNLRKELTTWLNNLAKDKDLPKRPADMSIVKSLKKVVKNLKETYSLMGAGGILVNDAGKSSSSNSLSQSSYSGEATATPPTNFAQMPNFPADSNLSSSEVGSPKMSEDVDLEFSGSTDDVQRTVSASRTGSAGQRMSLVEGASRLVLNVGDRGSVEGKNGGASRTGNHSSWGEKDRDSSSNSRAAGHQTSSRRVNQHGSTPSLGPPLSVQAPPPPLPHSHNALSRVFVNTVGRLARFKRVLGTARVSPFPFPNGPDAGLEDLEFEANDSGDLLFIRGGLENFINSFNLPPMAINRGIGAGPGREGDDSEELEGDESTDAENGGLISDGTTQDETPSLSNASGRSRSTPASSLDLSSDSSRGRAGLGIEGATNQEKNLYAFDDQIRISRRSRSGDAGADADAEDELDLSPPTKHHLDAANLLSLQRLHESESRNPVSDLLHHTTSEQTLRSTSTVEPKRGGANSPIKNVAASLRSQRSGEQQQFSRSGSRASHQSRKMAARFAFASGNEMSRSNSRISTTSGGQPRIVQIDDIDLSSDEDDGVVRRALRRLPGARDLRMANHVQDLEPSRQSLDSLSNSSLGRVHAAHASLSGFSMASYTPSMISLSGAAAAHAALARPTIGTVQTEMLDPDEALEGYELVRGFRLDGVDSDEDEPGDVEAALRRLEGVIDEEKQREKARRVERMWQDSQLRKAEDEDRKKSRIQSRSSARDARISRSEGEAFLPGEGEEEENDDGDAIDAELNPSQRGTSFESQSLKRQISSASRRTMEDLDEDEDSSSHRASRTSRTTYDQQRSPPPSTISLSPESSSAATPRTRAAALASSRPSAPRASSTGTSRTNRPVSHAGVVLGTPSSGSGPGSWAHAQADQKARAMDRAMASSKFGLWTLPPVHRSFLLGYRSEVIAQQLCLIEAELFKAVTWEELVSDRWKERSTSSGSEVVDWESFYQARVRERAENKDGTCKERAVEAIIARFNLTCNWVASEIVLTQSVDERAAVVSKLIRIAWKCYQQSNFATLTQIILGLQSPWVERLRKTWARIGMWEMRILRDLKSFTSPLRNFRHLRNAIQGMVTQSGMEDLVTSAGPPQTPGTQAYQGQGGSGQAQKARNSQGREVRVSDGCIPFFGLFISDLAVNDALPSYIDPSCPSAPVERDSTGALARLSKPDAFDHLQLLPPGVKFEPLINLYKFRVTAMTVKTILAFQERARAYQYEADGGVYVKCLKIRCLSGEQMTQISHHAEA